MIALLLLLQATPPSERFSILANCPRGQGDEVVVCAPAQAPRLPLPAERGPPDGPRKPTGDPRAALDAGDPGACAMRGCQVGVNVVGIGVAAVRLVGKLIDPSSCCERPGEATSGALLLHDAAAHLRSGRKSDRANRVPIALDAPPPPIAGRLSP